MKTRTIALFLAFALLLTGCGRSLDPETLALAEASEAACWVRVMERKRVPIPEGVEGNWSTATDGTQWGYLAECMLMEDFFDNLAPDGMPNRVFVLLDRDQYPLEVYSSRHKGKSLFLYLNLIPGYTQGVEYWNGMDDVVEAEYPVFTACGIRWETLDRECLRRMEALRAYGKAHPRDLIPHAAQ